MSIKVGISGCTGRMGQALVSACLAHPNINLVMGSIRKGKDVSEAEHILRLLGAGHMKVTDNAKTLTTSCDAVIDFTTPDVSLELASYASEQNNVLIIGTTGFNEVELQQLTAYSHDCRIVWSYNMSIGVNMLAALVQQVAGTLDEQFDIEIHEMHHRHKKDTPSGTAIMLGECAAKGRNISTDAFTHYQKGIGKERAPGTIGFASNRGGSVVGEHNVMFTSDNETITLSHRAHDRSIFASGAVKALLWSTTQPSGLYTMQDVLGLNQR